MSNGNLNYNISRFDVDLMFNFDNMTYQAFEN